MKPRAFARPFARDERGAGAVEFALVAPVFFMLVFGIIQLGWALHCASSVQYALERASRIVILDPGADEADVRAAMNAFLDDTARDEFGLTMEDISINGAAFARMTSTYDHAVDIPFVPVFSLHFTSVQLEPRPDT